jgi:hypothetical protein
MFFMAGLTLPQCMGHIVSYARNSQAKVVEAIRSQFWRIAGHSSALGADAQDPRAALGGTISELFGSSGGV